MYLGPGEAIGLFARVQERLRREVDAAIALPTVIVCPPAISLMAMSDIYGGTVTADNVGQFTAVDELDGVGATRATLDEDGFLTIVQQVARAGMGRSRG